MNNLRDEVNEKNINIQLQTKVEYVLHRLIDYISSHPGKDGCEDTLEVCIMRDAKNLITTLYKDPNQELFVKDGISYYCGDMVICKDFKLYGEYFKGILCVDNDNRIRVECRDKDVTGMDNAKIVCDITPFSNIQKL